MSPSFAPKLSIPVSATAQSLPMVSLLTGLVVRATALGLVMAAIIIASAFVLS